MTLSLLMIVLGCLISASAGNDVVLGVLGQSAFIECQLPVSKTLVWQTEDGNVIAINGKVTNENSTKYVIEKQSGYREFLVIHDLVLADDNLFRCVDLKNTSNVDTTQLTVLVRPLRINVTVSPEQPMLEGSEVTLTCEADGGKPLPEIQWFMKSSNGSIEEFVGNITDQSYNNGTGYRKNALTLNVTRDMYQSTFICNVTVPLLYQQTLPVDTDVLLAPVEPEIISRDYDGSFDEGSDLDLVCVSNGSHPTPSIYWLLNGNRVGDVEVVVIPSENGTTTVRSKLRMKMSRDYNGSVLTCAVTNKVLQDQGLPPRTANIILLASYKPILRIHQTEYTSKLGHNVTLQCHIDANPLPKFEHLYWTHKGAMLDRKYYELSNGSDVFSISLQNVKTSDAGGYSCHGINRLGASVSEQIRLSVLYAPVCEHTSVQKIAIKQGQIARLNCSMMASPSDVIFTWRYKTTEERISTKQGVADMRRQDITYSTLERTMGTSLRYGGIECYGSNTEGLSINPCMYQIVSPGPSEAPSNCSSLVVGSQVQVNCKAEFDGGSTQHFVLQQLVGFEFKALLAGDTPEFVFQAYSNVTIRLCSYNDDFVSIKNCAAPSAITVDLPGEPESDQSKGKNSHRSAYIAGGVIASIGFIMIAVIIALLLLRRYKKGKFTQNDKDLESGPENEASKSNKIADWWKSVSFKRFAESIRKTNKDQPSSTDVRNNEVITNLDDQDVPCETLGRLASTPYRPTSHRIDRNANCSILNMSKFQMVTENKRIAPDILNEGGFALSPIVARNNPDRHSIKTDFSIKYPEDVVDTTNIKTCLEETTDFGASNCYNTKDMLDVLCESDARGTSILSESEPIVNIHAKTLDKDYTDGDIMEVLGATEDEIKEDKDAYNDSKEHEEKTIASTIDDTGDFCDSHTIMKFMAVDFSAVSSGNDTASKINHIDANSFDDSVSATFDDSARQNATDIDDKECRLNRARSLPYRSRKQRERVRRINSFTEAVDSYNHRVKGYGRSVVPFDVYDKENQHEAFKEANGPSETTSSSNTDDTISAVRSPRSDDICDIDEFTLTINSETTTENDSKYYSNAETFDTTDCGERKYLSSAQSNTSRALPDIDEFTLTITSESGRESASIVEHSGKIVNLPPRLPIEIYIDSPDSPDLNDRKRFSPLRRDSFLEAINKTVEDSKAKPSNEEDSDDTVYNNTDSTISDMRDISIFTIDNSNIDSTISGKERSSPQIDSEAENSYLNHGYEKDSDAENKANGNDEDTGCTKDNTEDTVNVVAYF